METLNQDRDTQQIKLNAQQLIDNFERELTERLMDEKYSSPYKDMTDLLIKKYKLVDIKSMPLPSF
jgi:hypothetical protein